MFFRGHAPNSETRKHEFGSSVNDLKLRTTPKPLSRTHGCYSVFVLHVANYLREFTDKKVRPNVLDPEVVFHQSSFLVLLALHSRLDC